ncbi:MAG: retropepsin-like aspartic protease [Bermanella sp.]
MKYLLTLTVGLVLGFYLGVHRSGDDASGLVDATSGPVTAGSVVEPPAAARRPVIADHDLKLGEGARRDILLNIKRQQIDQSIDGLLFAALNQTQKQQVNNALHSHLIKLSKQKSWSLLERWLDALNSAGLTSSLYDRLQGLLLLQQGQYRAALEGLMAAHALVNSLAEQQRLMKEARHIVERAMQNFLTSKASLSSSQMADFLIYARQQLPNYTPASLALANLYRSNGDLQKSFDSLAFLPYDEQYSASVDELQQSLQAQMLNLSRNQQGIKLIKAGHQYLVRVQVDGIELTLMIDTGASYTALTKQAVAMLLAKGNTLRSAHKSVRVNTANGITVARLFTLSTLALNHARLQELTVLEVDMGENSRADGLLGMNFLSQFKFKIDQQNALLFLE